MENCTLESPQTSWAATRPSFAASAAVASSGLNSTTPPGCWVSTTNCLLNYPENSEQTHLAPTGSVITCTIRRDWVFKRNNRREVSSLTLNERFQNKHLPSNVLLFWSRHLNLSKLDVSNSESTSLKHLLHSPFYRASVSATDNNKIQSTFTFSTVCVLYHYLKHTRACAFLAF